MCVYYTPSRGVCVYYTQGHSMPFTPYGLWGLIALELAFLLLGQSSVLAGLGVLLGTRSPSHHTQAGELLTRECTECRGDRVGVTPTAPTVGAHQGGCVATMWLTPCAVSWWCQANTSGMC